MQRRLGYKIVLIVISIVTLTVVSPRAIFAIVSMMDHTWIENVKNIGADSYTNDFVRIVMIHFVYVICPVIGGITSICGLINVFKDSYTSITGRLLKCYMMTCLSMLLLYSSGAQNSPEFSRQVSLFCMMIFALYYLILTNRRLG